jgi:peptide-methionine (S)-S-oxide reductase
MKEIATLGGGCFWCLEAVFQLVEGVTQVVSGYSAGQTPNPNYKDVCSGTTGHAEVVQISFENTTVSFEELLKTFWLIHDPTTLNRQGADEGTQYRSIILFHDEIQRDKAQASIQEEQKNWKSPIVTQLEPLDVFFLAEDYHQNYYKNHPGVGYCSYVIRPKVEKFLKTRK